MSALVIRPRRVASESWRVRPPRFVRLLRALPSFARTLLRLSNARSRAMEHERAPVKFAVIGDAFVDISVGASRVPTRVPAPRPPRIDPRSSAIFPLRALAHVSFRPSTHRRRRAVPPPPVVSSLASSPSSRAYHLPTLRALHTLRSRALLPHQVPSRRSPPPGATWTWTR